MVDPKKPKLGTPSPPPVHPSATAWEDESSASRTTQSKLLVIAPGAKRGAVTVLTGLHAGQFFSVGSSIVIGRGRTSTLKLEDPGVSRQHARVLFAGEELYYVEDNKSKNGTFVNGKAVTRAELKDGDRIQIGPGVILRFTLVDQDEENLAKKLYQSSTRDALTGAYNRQYFDERLAAELSYAKRKGTTVGIILIDLDHFKQTNDTFGHVAGDKLLAGVAHTVSQLVRTEDVFARYGGEEFVVIARASSHDGLMVFAERIRQAVEATHIPWDKQGLVARASLGVASSDESKSFDNLLRTADERLFEAKRLGRNRVVGRSLAEGK